jgi:predicted dehydrogenase
METVRWGILGTGKIARAFAAALKDTPGAVLAGVASRSIDSAEAFGIEFGAAASYGSYQQLADAGDVDIIYIGTPHPMHAENALMALTAGKGVLCEKAFTMNRREAVEVMALAREKKLFLMEAMWTRFMPALAEVRRIIASGEIGPVHHVTADFGFTATQGRSIACSIPHWAAARCSTLGFIHCR